MKVLVDTHVLLWWFEDGQHLSKPARRVLSKASAENPLLVAEISLWEIATLFSLSRIRLDRPLRQWLDEATAPPLVERVPLSPAIAAETAMLPPSFHRDPADRIIVASARVLGATLLTHDSRIIKARIVPTLG